MWIPVTEFFLFYILNLAAFKLWLQIDTENVFFFAKETETLVNF